MRRGQRRTAVASNFPAVVKLRGLIRFRMQSAQATGMRRLGGKRFQQRLENAERNDNQQKPGGQAVHQDIKNSRRL
jgi:hypothetical protein